MLRDVETTLTGPLPCIHEIDPVSGEHTTSEAAPEGSANYVHTGTLTRLAEESDAKLETQVFNPIDKWISEVDVSCLTCSSLIWRGKGILCSLSPCRGSLMTPS